jgi:hypothetical protein
MAFREGDPPPFNYPQCPKFDVVTGEMKKAPKKKGKGSKNTYLVLMGSGEHAAPVPVSVPDVEKVIAGYVGKAKGMRVICHERGLLDPTKTYTISNEVFSFLQFLKVLC